MISFTRVTSRLTRTSWHEVHPSAIAECTDLPLVWSTWHSRHFAGGVFFSSGTGWTSARAVAAAISASIATDGSALSPRRARRCRIAGADVLPHGRHACGVIRRTCASPHAAKGNTRRPFPKLAARLSISLVQTCHDFVATILVIIHRDVALRVTCALRIGNPRRLAPADCSETHENLPRNASRFEVTQLAKSIRANVPLRRTKFANLPVPHNRVFAPAIAAIPGCVYRVGIARTLPVQFLRGLPAGWNSEGKMSASAFGRMRAEAKFLCRPAVSIVP